MTASLQNNAANTTDTSQTHPHKGWREVQSLVWLGIGLYLFIALATYSPLDPGWSRLSSDTLAVSNSAGVAGAWLSDLFFSFLGKAAFLLPLFCVFEVLAIWRSEKLAFKAWFRWLAQILLLVSTSGLCTLHSVELSETIQNAAGGIIGLELAQAMLHSFGLLNSTLLLGGVILLNGTLVTGFSWARVLEILGYAPYALLLKAKASYHQKTKEYQAHQQQQHALQQAAQQVEENFNLNISNHKVQAQIQPTERVEPSLHDLPILENESRTTPALGDTPQVLDELNQALAGFTQEMAVITPEMLAAAQAELPKLETRVEVEDQIDEPTSSILAEQNKLQQSQDLLTAEFGALLDDYPTLDNTPSSIQVNNPRLEAVNEQDIPAEVNETPVAMIEPVIDILVAQSVMVDEVVKLEPLPEIATVQKMEEKIAVEIEQPLLSDIETLAVAAQEPLIALEQEIVDSVTQLEPPVVAPIIEQTTAMTDTEIAKIAEIDSTEIESSVVDTAKPRMRMLAETTHSLENSPELAPTPPIEKVSELAAFNNLSDDDLDELMTIQAVEPPPLAVITPSAAIAQAMIAKPLLAAAPKSLSTLPSLDLLEKPDTNRKAGFTPEQLERLSRLLEIKLKEFNVEAKVVEAFPGPVVTRFEVDLAAGVKVSKITNIAKDLARSMAMISVRVVEAILGKTVIGIEVPNENRQIVRFREILDTPVYQEKESPITMALGKDISGLPMVADMARMPHLLVAGTTGSGKSVGVNAMILSILYKATPDEVRLILIDPKMLELSIYDKIPHLLTPVVTDMKDAANALRWSVAEMERRYKIMAAVGVRNLAGYNTKIKEAEERGENLLDPLWKKEDSGLMDSPPRLQPLPFIVIVIDEFADMMMVVGKKVEELIARIAQKARAAGIHLILATQRPSVDVITGLIKANVPSRIAFQVSSKIDSRTILDQGGAEQLLGHGDMLFQPIGSNLPVRIHGAFVSDDEVHRVCDHWRSCGEPNYIEEILQEYNDDGTPAKGATGGMGDEDVDAEQDVLYDDAVAFVLETRRASISFVQRKFKIGYNRAARLIEAMEMAGLVSSMQGNGTREVLVPNHE